VAELDWACRATAFTEAIREGIETIKHARQAAAAEPMLRRLVPER
jgi:hypothetical protein